VRPGRALCLLAFLAGSWGCGRAVEPGPSVIVLGFDGMDFDLTRRLMAEGQLPNFSRLQEMGGFQPLGTSIPPQSPVAWSDFITGMDAGGHGIFDFIHRDPATMVPYLSTSRAVGASRSLKLGKWQIPLQGGRIELLRRGQSFWEVLEQHGVPTTIMRIPANFPPSGTASRELSGMGTPDAAGTPGTFSFFTSEPFAFEGKEMAGGKVYPVDVVDNVVLAQLHGPDNPFLVEKKGLVSDFSVFIDPEEPLVKLVLGDEERIVRVGEWTDWVPFEFKMVPTQSLAAEVRFYLKSVRPEFQLYASPPNFDPMAPMVPLSTPAGFVTELARASGRFYTQGMPEDTHTLSEGVFDVPEFLKQARLAGKEILDQYPHVLAGFDGGLLFYYFGNGDQVSHMMWRSLDPGHPAYDPARDAPYADVIPGIYRQFDGVVGYTLEHMKPTTLLVVMSDHGFTSWRRKFQLNAWLAKNGYLARKDPSLQEDPGYFANVDWAKTRAYGLGINGLYINVRGRDRYGSVPPSERQALMDEIAKRLLATIDPKTGTPAITHVFEREQAYHDRGYLEVGPDLVVGYAKGWRCANESALGGVEREVFADNDDAWSGDHLMDPEAVPGILLTSRPLKRPAGKLKELAASILAEFGIEGFPHRQARRQGES